MAQFQYAFIVKAPGYSLGNQKVVFGSEAFRTNVVGVASVEEACEAAKELVKTEVKLIELCSGFKADDAKKVFDAIDGAAKVGYIGEFFVKE